MSNLAKPFYLIEDENHWKLLGEMSFKKLPFIGVSVMSLTTNFSSNSDYLKKANFKFLIIQIILPFFADQESSEQFTKSA